MSIHAMSDDEFEEFDNDENGMCFDAETQWNCELLRQYDELIAAEMAANPENYEDEPEPEGLTAYLLELDKDMPHPEDIGFDPETDCQNPF